MFACKASDIYMKWHLALQLMFEHAAGHAEVLLESMKEASVSGALIIQPGNHQFDHSYVTSVLRAHPDKFVGMLLANPTEVRYTSSPV